MNKDWREEFDEVFCKLRHDGYMELLNHHAPDIKAFINSILKSKQEEIEKAIDEMKGYVPHLPTIDPSLGELTDQDIDFVEHIDGQILFKSKVKPIISNILK